MIPPFDLQGGLPLVAARGVAVAALLSSFGTLTFRNLVAPKTFARMSADIVAIAAGRLLKVTQISAAVGLIAYTAWLIVESATMADAESAGEAVAAIPVVLRTTEFGHVILAQIGALVALMLLAGRHDRMWRQRAALGMAALAVILQAGHSHAFSMYNGISLLLAADVLHLFGAGAWLGGLLPLILVVWCAPPKVGATAARWFSPLGKWCVAALAVSAAFQGWVLVASIPGLVGTAYGWLVQIKLVLFAILLGFAAANRYRFAPALLRDDPEPARRVLIRSIVVQTGFAIAIVAAAVVLSNLPPSMHEQALWPFAERFSLAAVTEDADFRREVMIAGLSILGALAVLAATLILRRYRLAALVAASVVAWFAVPHLDLLLAAAYPTSYYHSPTGFGSDSITAGQAVYAARCVSCHGVAGRGDGADASNLPVRPADLTASHLWMHSDGDLFWWISHGIMTPEGAQAMPGFAAVLDDDQRWAVIDFIHANNAGHAMAASGEWPFPVRAPGFTAECTGRDLRLTDLRGRYVLLQFGTMANVSQDKDVVIVEAGPASPAEHGDCTSRDENVPAAYAIISGLKPQQLQSTSFLIDDHGWLRAMHMADGQAAWPDGASLQAEIRALRARKMAGAPEMPMKMPM